MLEDIFENGHRRAYLTGVSRVAKIHKEIASGNLPTVNDLVRQLAVSPRTIKRDIDVMRNCLNAPIVYDRRGGGFRYSTTGWSFPPSRMTEGEMLAFFIAENHLKTTGRTAEASLLKQALTKLAAMMPEYVMVDLEHIGENISFQHSPTISIDPSVLTLIAKSTSEHTPIEFEYYSPHSDESTSRIAEVHLLHNFLGDWYAVSYDRAREDFRDFNVGRMKNVRSIETECFEPQKGWNATEYLRRGFSMTRGGRRVGVSLLFDAYQSRWVRERGSFHPEEQREELPDGRLRLTFSIGEKGLEAVARFCLTYAGNCVAEKPKRLRNMVKDKAAAALRQH
jgi:predicted DNA-binding transcriptional regulator YafY